jgi:hypothetical protein
MPHPETNERNYPYIVELAVGEDGLEAGLGRRIMNFHNSRRIRPRHGCIILKEGKTYYRWCFSDLATAQLSSNSLAERSICCRRLRGSARPVCLAASRRQRNGDGINIVIDLRKL